MNQRLIASLAVPLAACAFAGAARAETATITTTATILATCKFRSVPAALAFPDIDPASDAAVTQDLSVQFSCTKDSAVKFAVNDKQTGSTDGTLTNGTQSLGYTVTWNGPSNLTSTGLTKGHSQANWATVKLTGTIPREAFQDAAAGGYTDATGLKLSVNP